MPDADHVADRDAAPAPVRFGDEHAVACGGDCGEHCGVFVRLVWLVGDWGDGGEGGEGRGGHGGGGEDILEGPAVSRMSNAYSVTKW